MESKILIDINYASRSPQILIKHKDSEDPRDKLISMFTGESMPGVSDGYCRIERYPKVDGEDSTVITPIHPVDMIKHLSAIVQLAHDNPVVDTAGVKERYMSFVEAEYIRLRIGGVEKKEA